MHTLGLAFLLTVVILTTFPPGTSSASVGKIPRKDDPSRHVHLQKREVGKSGGHSEENVLLSAKMDSAVMTKLGNMKLDHKKPARDRRNHDSKIVEQHVKNAEVDSIAAAKESAAAGTHAIAAAVETSEAEQILEENGTFEEDDAGDMVRVPTGGHGYNHGFDSSDESHSHTDSHSDEFSSHSHDKSFGEHEDESSGKIPDVETSLGKLYDQSTDLAKETAVVFQVIAKREDYLVGEMERFKQALQSAIEILQQSESKLRTKRWDNMDRYRACVYVTPKDPNDEPPPGRYVYMPEIPQPVTVAATEPPTPPPEPLPENPAAFTQTLGDDIDLSSVYWLKLPQNDEGDSLDKVQRLLGQVRPRSRDMLIIPVRKGFKNAGEIANEFLRVVNAKSNMKLRRKLRVRIRRV